MNRRPLVVVVDDSASVRESLPDLLEHVGFAVQAFPTAEAFLASDVAHDARCLILDVGLPGMSGPDLLQELRRRGNAIPVVFITAQDDNSLQLRLFAGGAAACLFKPFSDSELLKAVDAAVRTRQP
jgi:FixJ family two-component response regulator